MIECHLPRSFHFFRAMLALRPGTTCANGERSHVFSPPSSLRVLMVRRMRHSPASYSSPSVHPAFQTSRAPTPGSKMSSASLV